MRTKLTAKIVAALKPKEIARDSACPGFFAQRGKTDTSPVSLKVQADLRPDAATRIPIRITLGRFPDLSVDAARAEAMRLLADVKEGKDPRAAPPPPTGAAHWTVGKGFEKYIEDLTKTAGTELSRRDMAARLARYLDDWRELPLRELTKEMCEARQLAVAATIKASARQRNATGARTANAVVRDLSAVWNFAADYTPLPPASPTRRIKMIGEVREHHEVPIAELGAWWVATGALKNPLRRSMHRLGLLSGLRPGNLTAIERAWIRADLRAIDFPARVMKNRQPFTLPLSSAMAQVVREALMLSRILEPAEPGWLFPSRGKDGALQPVTVVREKAVALLNRTGHALRHTWKTCARNARVPESTIEILLAHALSGQRGTYGSIEDQLDMLREEQEKVTAYIMARVTPAPG